MFKECAWCNEAKPLSDFYKKRGTPDGRDYRCKECMKAYQRIKYREYQESGRPEPPSTAHGRAILQKRGIPVTPGGSIGIPHIDLIAWGCVPIEVKGAHERMPRQFYWGFTARQRREVKYEGLFMLLAWHKSGLTRVFVLPCDRAWFIEADGFIHGAGPTVTLDSRHGNSQFWPILKSYEDAYYLIEEARLQYSAMLAEQVEDDIGSIISDIIEESTPSPLPLFPDL